MRRSLTNRLTALAASVALCVATSAFWFHGHRTDGGQQQDLRCELCLQYSGSAGAAPAPALVAIVALIVWIVGYAASCVPLPGPRARAHQARAPPALT